VSPLPRDRAGLLVIAFVNIPLFIVCRLLHFA
jgi:hypothetical protein